MQTKKPAWSFQIIVVGLYWLCACPRAWCDTEPKVRDALIPLQLKQAELAGEIGRRINNVIYKNFMVLNLEQDFIAPFRTRPPLEANAPRYIGVGKVIDAGSKFAAYTGDPEVARRTAWLIEELMKTRDPDGYLGHIKPEPGGWQNYYNWILHDQEYVILGLVNHWRYLGDKKSLQYARQLADYVMDIFPKNPHPEHVCTAGLPEAMLALYAAVGDKRYLEFAADVRHGNSHGEIECCSLREWEKSSLENFNTNHVYVNLARCYSQTLLYRWEPEEKLLKSSRFFLRELTRKGGGLFIIGSASEDEHFSYSQEGRGKTGESCVTAYLIRWLDSLLRLEGDLRYGDIMERAIYNALFAAQDPAGRRLRYFTPFTGPREYYERDGFCCPGNHRRIMAELPEMVYYRTQDGGVAINLFTKSVKTIELQDSHKVTIEQQTDYPTTGLVKISVSPSASLEFPLWLRIPRWCTQAHLVINNQPPEKVSPGGKYYEIRRLWRPGDTITLDMPMPWRLVRGCKLQEGRVALMRGPVVFCIGAKHNADLLKNYKNPGELVLDPASLGDPVRDDSFRPHGVKVITRAWPSEQQVRNSPSLTLVLSEFIDPTGVATYFRVPDLSEAVDDELWSDSF